MKKPEVLQLVNNITPDTPPEEVAAAAETLRSAKGLNKVFIVNAAQEVFDLKTVSGMKVLSEFNRDNLVRVVLARQSGVFDFASVVFPRKDPSGREEGSYTWPSEDLVMAAIDLAYEGRFAEIDIDGLMPDPQHVGGKPVTVPLKQLCPRAAGSTKSGTARKPRAPRAAAAADTQPETPTTPVQETSVPPTTQTLDNDEIARAVASLIVPGIGRGFAAQGEALHAIAHVLTVTLQRQEELADRQYILACYLDPNAELPDLTEAPTGALQALIGASNRLRGADSAPVYEEVEGAVSAPEAYADTSAYEASGEEAAPPPPAKTETKKAAPKAEAKAAPVGDLYTEADVQALGESEIDLRRVDYSDQALRFDGYGIGSLKKILVAFGETPGAPTRGAIANRIIALAKRDGYRE